MTVSAVSGSSVNYDGSSKGIDSDGPQQCDKCRGLERGLGAEMDPSRLWKGGRMPLGDGKWQ